MPLLDRLDHSQRTYSVEGDLPFHSVYTVGIAGERFFRALKDEGKIMGTRCARCDVMYVPGRLYCEQCFSHLDDAAWFDAGSADAIAIRSMMYMSMSYDHRVVDGAVADQYLAVVKHSLETFDESAL